MKTIIYCLFLLGISIFGKAQNKVAPTKEETISYIKSYFAAPFFTNGLGFSVTYKSSAVRTDEMVYKITSLEFYDCTMTVTYEMTKYVTFKSGQVYKEDPKLFTSTIDFSKVESMGFQIIAPAEAHSVYGLFFNYKGQGSKDRMELPIAGMPQNSSNIETLEKDKPYKAFNHLRKLCGAPEPIEF